MCIQANWKRYLWESVWEKYLKTAFAKKINQICIAHCTIKIISHTKTSHIIPTYFICQIHPNRFIYTVLTDIFVSITCLVMSLHFQWTFPPAYYSFLFCLHSKRYWNGSVIWLPMEIRSLLLVLLVVGMIGSLNFARVFSL